MNQLILKGYQIGDKNGGPTALAKIFNESLVTCNGFNKNDLVKRYQNWWDNGAFDTGPTFAMVFTKISNGVPVKDAAKAINKKLNGKTAGCGPAHRIAPLSSFFKIQINTMIKIAREESKITHYHPDAGNCSAVMALLCRYLLKGHTWCESKELVSKCKDIDDIWIKIQNASLNNDGHVLNVMHSALYFLERSRPVEKSIEFAGPSNYCPIIVGIIQSIINSQNNLIH